MRRGKAFRSRFDMRLHQLQKTADEVGSAMRGQATELAEQAREGLMRGKNTVWSWEKWAGRSMRANPVLYAGAALVVFGLALVLLRPVRRNRKDAS
ncbi:MAG: hypothetical protein PHQ12_13340 [Chthoniobacteraceae bacterium]|nr:hypothetical protein [Chthoniobacteraceae bacterium]